MEIINLSLNGLDKKTSKKKLFNAIINMKTNSKIIIKNQSKEFEIVKTEDKKYFFLSIKNSINISKNSVSSIISSICC